MIARFFFFSAFRGAGRTILSRVFPMGGLGAFLQAMSAPESYAAAASLSGVLDPKGRIARVRKEAAEGEPRRTDGSSRNSDTFWATWMPSRSIRTTCRPLAGRMALRRANGPRRCRSFFRLLRNGGFFCMRTILFFPPARAGSGVAPYL